MKRGSNPRTGAKHITHKGTKMGFFDKFKAVEQTAKKVENIVIEEVKAVELDAKSLFEKAKADAIAANGEVNRLKAELQSALARARDLHQAAAEAAQKAADAAEADAVRLKAAISAHLADFKTQASQVIAPPAPPAPEPAPAIGPAYDASDRVPPTLS